MISPRLLAHEYYVLPASRVAETYREHVDIFSTLENPLHLRLFAIASGIGVLVMIMLLILAQYRRVHKLRADLHARLGVLAIPLIRIALGIVLLASSFSYTAFGPEISLDSLPMVFSLQPILFTAGLCFILGVATSFSAVLLLLVFVDALLVRNMYMLTYTYYAGIAFIYISKYIFNISNNTKLAIIRIAFGVSLLYTAIEVKLMHAGLSLATVQDFRLGELFPFDPLFIVFGAFVVEAMLGICFITGAFVRTAAMLTLLTYTGSLMYFPSESLWPHLLPMVICLALVAGHQAHFSLDRVLNRLMRGILGMPQLKDIKTVILGGGFGGISAALELASLAGDHGDITLVNDTEYHALHPAFYETATDEQPHRSVAIPLASIFRATGVQLKIGTVTEIDTKHKQLKLKNNERITYDRLVLATGSESNDFNTPGVKEFGIPLKTLNEAMEIQSRIRKLFENACNEEVCHPIHIVIGGGGFTGVELVGEVLHYSRKLQEQFRVPPELVHVHLVHSQPYILSGLDEKIGRSAQQRLADMGVDMVMGSRISSVTESYVILKDERKVPCSLLIWTAGIKGCSLLSTSGLEIDKENHVFVNHYLQAKNAPDVYVCGDAAAYQLAGSDPEKPRFAPAVAQVAKEQGRTVGRNIYYEMCGEALEGYRYRHMGYVIPVSGKYAYAHLNHFSFKGFTAYLLQQFIILQWFLTILPLPVALMRFDTFAMELFTED